MIHGQMRRAASGGSIALLPILSWLKMRDDACGSVPSSIAHGDWQGHRRVTDPDVSTISQKHHPKYESFRDMNNNAHRFVEWLAMRCGLLLWSARFAILPERVNYTRCQG